MQNHTDAKREAIACLKSGKLAEAERLLRQECLKNPSDPEIWYQIGVIEANTQRVPQAVKSLESCLQQAPRFVQAIDGLGSLYWAQGRFQQAEQCYRQLVELTPDNSQAHYNLGVLLQQNLKLDEANDRYRTALALRPAWLEANNNLAYTLYSLGQLDEAYQFFRATLDLRSDYEPAAAGAARILEKRARYQEAYALIEPFLQSGDPSYGVLIVYSFLCKHFHRCDDAIKRIENLVSRQAGPHGERSQLYFALTRLYDHKHLVAKAFSSATSANKLKNMMFNRVAFASNIDSMIGLFGDRYWETMSDSGCRSEKPVFIVGMPRSGTSLVEQIIAAHPQAYGAGELNDIPRAVSEMPLMFDGTIPYPDCVVHMKRPDLKQIADAYLARLESGAGMASKITDKLPLNYLHLGLISLLFPKARIIHCKRDPMDTCLSCYFNDFAGIHEFAYDLEDLGFYYKHYQRLMGHWKETLRIPIVEVCYEDLVREPEKNTRMIIGACGLEWEEACLNYYETERYAHTLSYEDVRQPLYSSAIGRWVAYKKYLTPLARALQQS
jgi:tetratricopeptide (TPR) repeat protein